MILVVPSGPNSGLGSHFRDKKRSGKRSGNKDDKKQLLGRILGRIGEAKAAKNDSTSGTDFGSKKRKEKGAIVGTGVRRAVVSRDGFAKAKDSFFTESGTDLVRQLV